MTDTPKRTVDPDILAAAKSHPEATYVQLGPKKYLFLLNMYGAEIAREKGHDPIPAIFRAIERLIPAIMDSGIFDKAMKGEEKVTEEDLGFTGVVKILGSMFDGQVLEDFCLVVWWGILTAQPNTTLAEVKMNLTPSGLKKAFEDVWPKMLSYAKDINEDDEDAVSASGEGEAGGESGN